MVHYTGVEIPTDSEILIKLDNYCFCKKVLKNSITVINISGVTNHLEKLISRGIAVANTKIVQKMIFLFNITVNYFLGKIKQFLSSFSYSESRYNDDIYQANQKQ